MDDFPALKLELNDEFEFAVSPTRNYKGKLPKPPPLCLLVTDSQNLVSSSDTLGLGSYGKSSNEETSIVSCSEQFCLCGTQDAFAYYASSDRFSSDGFSSDEEITALKKISFSFHSQCVSSSEESADTIRIVSSFLGRIDDDLQGKCRSPSPSYTTYSVKNLCSITNSMSALKTNSDLQVYSKHKLCKSDGDFPAAEYSNTGRKTPLHREHDTSSASTLVNTMVSPHRPMYQHKSCSVCRIDGVKLVRRSCPNYRDYSYSESTAAELHIQRKK